MEEDPSLVAGRGDARRRWARSPAPIIAITLVLLSVFVPVAFIPGISGAAFRQFAVAVSVAMVISAINALTLSPGAVRRVPAAPVTGRSAGRCATCSARIDWARDGYAAVVARLVRVRRLSSLVADRRRSSARPICFSDHADRLPAGGGPGRLLRRGAAARGRLGQPHRGGRRAGRGDLAEASPGVPSISVGRRLQLARRAAKSNSAFLDRAAEAVRGAHDAALSVARRSSPSCAASSTRSARPTSSPSTCRRSSASAPAAASNTSSRTCAAASPADLAASCAAWSSPPTRTRACAACSRPSPPTRRSSTSTSTATRCRRWASPVATSSTRCRRRWAASTSTTSTCSAAPGRSTSRARRPTATASTTSTASTCATATARWCRCAPSPSCA